LTITADSKSKRYGAELPALTASYAGFVNGDSAVDLTKSAVLTTPATVSSAVGNYPINASGAGSPNYDITFNAGSLSITKAALAIAAENKAKVYGAALPELTATYTGFVNGDSAASLDSPTVLSTSATVSSPVGSYEISAGSAASVNYNISFVVGALTVIKAPLTITAENKSKQAGELPPNFTATFMSFVNGDTATSLLSPLQFTTTATTDSPPGAYEIVPSGATSPNYEITFRSGTLTVEAAAAPELHIELRDNSLVITWTGGGTLEFATKLGGPFQTADAANGRFETALTTESQFFRVKR
jgi:hypothetical protein